MAVFATDEARIEIDGRAEQVFGQSVSGSFFDVLGVAPVLGRLLTPDDEAMAPPVAVISYGYWQRRFGGRADVLGRTITLGTRPCTIVGVTPPEFSGLQPGRRVELTTPMAREQPQSNSMASRGEAIARLRPGVTIAQASAISDSGFQSYMQTVTVDAQLRRSRFQRLEAVPAARGLAGLRDRYSTSLQTLMALAVAVLLIGCWNLGTLLLVRGAARAREMAIRQATGASAARLLSQMLTETLLLFALGSAAGLVVARVTVDAIVGFFAVGRNAIELDAPIDWRVAAFAAGVALVAAVFTGIWPALHAMRVDPQQAMRSGDPRLGGAPRARAAARLLIVGQVVLCLTLLVATLMFATTMRNLRSVDPGFAAERVLTQSLNPVMSGATAADDRAQFWTRVLARMQAMPGARASSISILTPMSGRDTPESLSGPGMEKRQPVDRLVRVNHVSEDYLTVFGIRLLHGRPFSVADRTARRALVNETTQAELFPGRSAVGETLDFGEGRRYQIVGVVQDSTHRSLREPKPRMVYLPLWQALSPLGRVTLSVATEQAPMALAGEIARQVREVEPSTLVSDVFDVVTQVDATLIGERLLAALGTAFAVLALTLVAIGVYGVLSYSVAERRGEIALRMALGAPPLRLGWDIAREMQRPIVAGIAFGLPAAWATSRMAQALLFDVTPLDAGMYFLAIVVLVAVAGGAALLPMRRAASLNPADVLRQ